ncbi:MAG TPA: single-stranded DNA-binding protein [Dehalococcoidia bacterium]|nr:single-stranded DNA-binding protein [Dehalococcoidia bacterium]HLB28707.1 single-stranded DNA-binding protein [Dehalococcoidia bacterium]
MRDLVKAIVIGRLGTDPEMRFTANGKPVTSFRFAANRNYTTADGERHEDTEWFDVVCWGKLAEHCSQYLHKGRRAYVEGRLRIRSWEAPDGARRYRPEVTADTVLFLDRPETAPLGEEEILEPDELPFE